MNRYLVEAYLPCYTHGGRGEIHIRARRISELAQHRDYIDSLSPEMVKYAIVEAPSIVLARDSMVTMGQFNRRPVVLNRGW